jgi:hypothetical protein
MQLIFLISSYTNFFERIRRFHSKYHCIVQQEAVQCTSFNAGNHATAIEALTCIDLYINTEVVASFWS